jgi:hypothetical protein
MNDDITELSDRIKELGDKATQLLTFLSFALAAAVLLETSSRETLTPPQKRLVTIAALWWIGAVFPILFGILPWKEFGWKKHRWYSKVHCFKFVLLWIAVPMILFGAWVFCRAIWSLL